MGKRKRRVTLEEQIRNAAIESQLSHYRIALDTGISQSVVTRFLNGDRSISLATADKLCEHFGLELRAKKR